MQKIFTIRPMQEKDGSVIGQIAKSVLPEFGAVGPGYAIEDSELDHMFQAYSVLGRGYFVVECAGEVLGGAGFAPLEGGPIGTCELRKMYFLPELRGQGMGQKLLAVVIQAAKENGYNRMYAETLCQMTAAKAVYEKGGFEKLSGPLGNTGHFKCDAWYDRCL